MFKLIFDESYVEAYREYLSKCQGVSPDKINSFSYAFLSLYTRPIVSSIFGERFYPVKILVSIRTDHTNEVIVPDNGKFYTDCTAQYPNVHPLDDTIILAAKSLVDKLFDCGEDIVKVIPRTIPYPVGACIVDKTVYVYMNVVIDHKLKEEEFFKLKDCHFESIESLSTTSPLEEDLKHSLILVKGDTKNVSSDDYQG